MAEKNKRNKMGIYAMSSQEKSEAGKKGAISLNSQKWKCTITGKISNPGALSRYQKKRGIDTANRIRIDLT